MLEQKINFHYTAKCDAGCNFCFRRIASTENEEKILNTMKQLVKKTKAINFVGGEVFLNIRLLRKLVEIGVNNDVVMSLVTNGLVLSKEKTLKNDDVIYILKHIDVLGISIDSFKRSTLVEIGRCDKDKNILDITGLKRIANACYENNVHLKINTVATRKNLNENMVSQLEKEIKNQNITWKQLMVVSDDPKYKITLEEFEEFTKLNSTQLENIKIKVESNEVICNSYVIVNSQGNFIYDQDKKYDDLTIYNIEKIDQLTHFDLDAYNSRYGQMTNLKVNLDSIGMNMISDIAGKRLLFFDVEAFSPATKHEKLKKYPGHDYPFLWTAILVNGKNEIEKKFCSYLDKGFTSVRTYSPKMLYVDFINMIKENDIDHIVVSGAALENTFIDNTLVYALNEFRNFNEVIEVHSKTKKKIYDIQSLTGRILVQGTKMQKLSTKNVMKDLQTVTPELLQYKRRTHKDNDSSFDVPFEAERIYTGVVDFNNIQNLVDYCFDDVYADLALYRYAKSIRHFGTFNYKNSNLDSQVRMNMHIHTNNSDGIDTYEQVIDNAKKFNTQLISVTNHDTVLGLEQGLKYAKEMEVNMISGVELSVNYEGKEIHILGYDFDVKKMAKILSPIKEQRDAAAKKFVKLAIEAGHEIIDELPYDTQIITRGRVSDMLINQHVCKTKTEAYEIINAIGYDDVPLLEIDQAIEIIKKSNGVAVLAHPFEYINCKTNKKETFALKDLDTLVSTLKKSGVDGLECYYNDYSIFDIMNIESLAKKYDLKRSVGSDYHNKQGKKKNFMDVSIHNVDILTMFRKEKICN